MHTYSSEEGFMVKATTTISLIKSLLQAESGASLSGARKI